MVTLDQQPSENEETVTDHQNVTHTILQQREMARMRQLKKRKTETNEQTAGRRQKILENTRRRRSNETEEERVLRKQKVLHNVRLRRLNETVQRRHIRL